MPPMRHRALAGFFPATKAKGKFTGAAERTLVLPTRPVAAVLVTRPAVLLTGEIETRFEDEGEDCDSTTQSPTICGLGGPFMLWRPGFGQR